jgi:hypothetical protein
VICYRYADGSERAHIRVEHRLTRAELQGALWRIAVVKDFDSTSPDLPVDELETLLRQGLWFEGRDGALCVPAAPDQVDPGAWDWTSRQMARLWPPAPKARGSGGPRQRNARVTRGLPHQTP